MAKKKKNPYFVYFKGRLQDCISTYTHTHTPSAVLSSWPSFLTWPGSSLPQPPCSSCCRPSSAQWLTAGSAPAPAAALPQRESSLQIKRLPAEDVILTHLSLLWTTCIFFLDYLYQINCICYSRLSGGWFREAIVRPSTSFLLDQSLAYKAIVKVSYYP